MEEEIITIKAERATLAFPAGYVVSIKCPYCHGTHTHGFGDGYRVPHCPVNHEKGSDYKIVGCDDLLAEDIADFVFDISDGSYQVPSLVKKIAVSLVKAIASQAAGECCQFVKKMNEEMEKDR